MPTEQEHVATAQTYTPAQSRSMSSPEAKRESAGYFKNYGGDNDTRFRREMLYRGVPSNLLEQVRAEVEGSGPAIDDPPPGPVNQAPAGANFQPPLTGGTDAPRDTAYQNDGPGAPEPKPAAPQMASMSGANAAHYGNANYHKTLENKNAAVQGNEDGRKGKAPLPGAAPPATQNASVPPEGGGRPYDTLDPGKVTLHSAQSQDQGVVEPAEALRRRDEAEALESQAIDETTFLDSIAADEMLRISNKRIAEARAQARADQLFAERQARIAAETESRIARAEQALKEAEVDPNFNPMREIMEGGDWGKKLSFMLGMLGGSIGAQAQTQATGIYHSNKFLESFEKAVDRKIDLMEKRYRARKDYLGAAQDGYARMRQILQDEQATRAMIQAKAWQMFDLEVDKVLQQHNVDMADPRAKQLKAASLMKFRGAAMESARTTNHVTAVQEQQKDLKVVPLGGGEDKTGSNIDKIVQAREVKKLPIIEGAMDNVATAMASMAKSHTYRDNIAHWLRTGGDIDKKLAPYIAENQDAFVRIAAAANDYVQSKAGSAQTEGEVGRLAPVIGKGGADGLKAAKRFYDILQNEQRAKNADIQTMDGHAEFERRKGAYASQPDTQTYVPRVDHAGAPAVK